MSVFLATVGFLAAPFGILYLGVRIVRWAWTGR